MATMASSGRAVKVVAACVLGMSLLSGSGCVARSEYDRVKFALGRSEQAREDLNSKLSAERARTNALEVQLQEKEGQLAGVNELLASLRGQNSDLSQRVKDLVDRIQALASKPSGVETVIVKESTALPPGLDQALKDFAAKYPDVVEFDSATGIVRFKSDLTFALGSFVVTDRVKPILKEFAQIALSPDAAEFDVVVVGHTDTVPIRNLRDRIPTNWHLSAFRAVAVLQELVSDGLDPARIALAGYGEHRPIAENPPTGNERNRRVEILLVRRNLLTPVAARIPRPSAAPAATSDAPTAGVPAPSADSDTADFPPIE